MSLSLLLNIPGLVALVAIFYQNRNYLRVWLSSKYDKLIYWANSRLGVFYSIDDAVFTPFIFFSNNTTSFSYSMSASTINIGNSAMAGTISATNGADLVFANSNYQLSLTQLASALNELKLVRQELCEYKVKFGTKIHELELLLKEKEK